MAIDIINEQFEAAQRLNNDLRKSATLLTSPEARYLVSVYYDIQEQRIRSMAQLRAAAEQGEPNSLLVYLSNQYEILENNARNALNAYAKSEDIGKWSLSITGIGPVIAAGLMAHIDIRKAPTAGHIWSFAGITGHQVWNKGEKRPWNADLKVLCWKIGESFVITSGRESSFYGEVYKQRKALEIERNEQGLYAEQAEAILNNKRFSRDTVAKKFYTEGKLPPAHIHARARRYAVKMFLSHWHHVAYEVEFNISPPTPYMFAFGGGEHVHYIAPPNWPMDE